MGLGSGPLRTHITRPPTPAPHPPTHLLHLGQQAVGVHRGGPAPSQLGSLAQRLLREAGAGAGTWEGARRRPAHERACWLTACTPLVPGRPRASVGWLEPWSRAHLFRGSHVAELFESHAQVEPQVLGSRVDLERAPVCGDAVLRGWGLGFGVWGAQAS